MEHRSHEPRLRRGLPAALSAEGQAGLLSAVEFKMPGAPFTCWLSLAILAVVFLSMVLPGASSTWWMSLAGTVLLLGSITVGYELSKRRLAWDETQAQPENAPSSISA